MVEGRIDPKFDQITSEQDLIASKALENKTVIVSSIEILDWIKNVESKMKLNNELLSSQTGYITKKVESKPLSNHDPIFDNLFENLPEVKKLRIKNRHDRQDTKKIDDDDIDF